MDDLRDRAIREAYGPNPDWTSASEIPMPSQSGLISERFPRSSKYNPEWLTASVSGGANPLWLTEWLAEALELRPGMRILDLGCGRAVSSIFLHHEFDVQVWATDLWFSASENRQRIDDAGSGDGVFPIHANARALPFASEYFDVIVSIDSFFYYGTDDLYLSYLTRFLKPGGQLGIAGAGLVREFDGELPEHLREWWTAERDLCCLHSAEWWRRHWDRAGILDLERADTLPGGWRFWLAWHQAIAPENSVEIAAIAADQGRNLGYARAVGRRRDGVHFDDPVIAIPAQYSKKALFRGDE